MKYEHLTKGELQDALRRRELPTSGSKEELVRRLDTSDQDQLLSLRRDDLRAQLRELGLSVAGTKDELIERLAAADVGRPAPVDTELATERAHVAPSTDDEVFDSVAGAAQQLVGSLNRRGVPVDRILSAFRSAGQAVTQQVRLDGGERDTTVTGADAAPTPEDQSIIEKLISVFSEVVDQSDDLLEEMLEPAERREPESSVEPDVAGDRSGPGYGPDPGYVSRGGTAMELVRRAARQLEQLSGRRVDGVVGFRPNEGGWRIELEAVEVSRVPPATDVIGSYEVVIDSDGELVCFERTDRYTRGQTRGDVT